MGIGDNLTSQAKVTAGDQVIILSTNGGARRTSMSALSDFVKIAIGASAGSTGGSGGVGAVGPPGPQGIPGVQGATGATGPAGPTGPRGLQGAPGIQGIPGTAANVPANLNDLLARVLPEGGSPGQTLVRTSNGYAWATPTTTTTPTQPSNPSNPPAEEDYTEETAAMDSSASNMRSQTATLD